MGRKVADKKYMYQIEKILNNNTVLVNDDETEGVIIYKGIGFDKKNGEKIEVPKNAKLYIMQKSHKSHRLKEKMQGTEPIYIEIAGEVLKYAQDKYHLNVEGQLTPLTMTIYFSVKLLNDYENNSNAFNDLYFFYPREYNIALKAKEVIQKYTNIVIDDNQINHIAVYLNSCFLHNVAETSENIIQIIFNEIADIEKDLNIEIDHQSVSFVRMLRHIRFNLNNPKRKLLDFNQTMQQDYPYVYEKSKALVNKLSMVLDENIQKSEIGYLAMHIEELIINSSQAT